MAYRFSNNWMVLPQILVFTALVSGCSGNDPEVSSEVEVPSVGSEVLGPQDPQVGSDTDCRDVDNCVTNVDDEPVLTTVFRTHSGQFIQDINTQVRGVVEYQQNLTFVYVPESNQRVAFVLDSYSQDEVGVLNLPDRETDFDDEYLNQTPDLDLLVQSTERGVDIRRIADSRSKHEALVIDLEQDVQYEITVSVWDRDHGSTTSDVNAIGAFNLKIVDANRESLGLFRDEVLVDYYCVDRLYCRSGLNSSGVEFWEDFERENSLAAPTDEQGDIDQVFSALLDTSFQLIINRQTGEVRRYRKLSNLGYRVRGLDVVLERDASTSDFKALSEQRIVLIGGNDFDAFDMFYSVDFEGSYEGGTFLNYTGPLLFSSRVLIP